MGNVPNAITNSQIKLDKIFIGSKNNKEKINSYYSSKYFSSVGLLLQGEKYNPESDSRNAMITITNMRNQTSVKKILVLDTFPGIFI